MGFDISEVMVERIDILKEMEILNQKMRSVVVNKTNPENLIEGYDWGVKNTMSALESLVTHSADGERDRLIYQKYGERSDVVWYELLSDVLKELKSSGQLDLVENGGDD